MPFPSYTMGVSVRFTRGTKIRIWVARRLFLVHLIKLGAFAIRKVVWEYRIGNGRWRRGGVTETSLTEGFEHNES